MSKKYIYRIYDSKADAWMMLIQHQNEETAKRELGSAVNKEGNTFNLYAEDYTLFEVGYFTEEEPLPVIHQTAVSVCQAITLRKAAPAQIPFQMPISNGVNWDIQKQMQKEMEDRVIEEEQERLNNGGAA